MYQELHEVEIASYQENIKDGGENDSNGELCPSDNDVDSNQGRKLVFGLNE